MIVQIDCLLFPTPVLAGANMMVINSLAYRMLTSDWRPDPIKVKRTVPGSEVYRIVDGRHRTMAAICVGLTEIEAEVVSV